MNQTTHSHTRQLVLAALFLALGLALPFLTGSIPQIGSMLCPMHLPVLLGGFVLGGPWGLAIGAAFAHNFGLAASGEGPTANGKIAVVIGIAVVLAIACLNTYRSQRGEEA